MSKASEHSEWIDWRGGDCPVSPDATVEYILENPRITDRHRAGDLDWQDRNPFLAIVAYREVRS